MIDNRQQFAGLGEEPRREISRRIEGVYAGIVIAGLYALGSYALGSAIYGLLSTIAVLWFANRVSVQAAERKRHADLLVELRKEREAYYR